MRCKTVFAVLAVMTVFSVIFAASAPFSAYASETEEAETEWPDEDGDGIRDPIDGDLVTDEMLEEGWVVMSDGLGYPPEYFEEGDVGATSATVASFNDEDGLVNVTFHAEVPEGETSTMVVYFAEISSYLEYGIELYYTADYTTTVQMPAGSYYFTSGGPYNDYYGAYTVSDPESFTVEDSAANYVEFTISLRGDTLGFYEEEEAEEEEAGEEDAVQSGTLTEEKSYFKIYLMLAAGFIGAGLLVCFVIWKKTKYEEEHKR